MTPLTLYDKRTWSGAVSTDDEDGSSVGCDSDSPLALYPPSAELLENASRPANQPLPRSDRAATGTRPILRRRDGRGDRSDRASPPAGTPARPGVTSRARQAGLTPTGSAALADHTGNQVSSVLDAALGQEIARLVAAEIAKAPGGPASLGGIIPMLRSINDSFRTQVLKQVNRRLLQIAGESEERVHALVVAAVAQAMEPAWRQIRLWRGIAMVGVAGHCVLATFMVFHLL